MALPRAHEDREYQNFVEVSGTPHRRVTGSISGTVTVSSPATAGRITIVPVDNTSWTALPVLANRQRVAIQNFSGQQVKLTYDNTEPGYIGVVIPDNGERHYDIAPTLIQYIKSQTSACNITVEELA